MVINCVFRYIDSDVGVLIKDVGVLVKALIVAPKRRGLICVLFYF